MKAFALLSAFVCMINCAMSRSYHGHSVYRLEMEKHQIEEILTRNYDFDVWRVKGNQVDVHIPPQLKPFLLTSFPQAEVVVEDIQDLIDSEISARKPWKVGNADFFDTFRDYDEIETWLDDLIASNPSILQKIKVGTTYENREIYGVRLSTGGSNKKAIVVGATVHAREWLATTTSLWALDSLVSGYNSGETRIVNILRSVEWYFIPVVNADGYIYTWTNDRLWRKNRRRNEGSSFYGVDLNRNWGPNSTWCTAGSSKNPSSDTYCGTGAFSEPETTAYSNLLVSLPNLKAVVDTHTYGQLILRPYQYSYTIPPEPYNTIVRDIGDDMETAVNAVNRAKFESIRGVELYPHSGGCIDYTYFELNIPAFTYELRGNSFIVPDSDIPISGTETFAGLLVLGEWVVSN